MLSTVTQEAARISGCGEIERLQTPEAHGLSPQPEFGGLKSIVVHDSQGFGIQHEVSKFDGTSPPIRPHSLSSNTR